MKPAQIRVLTGLIVVISVVAILAEKNPGPADYFKAFSYSVSGISVALFLWERWLWRWRLFRPWLTTRPDLRGTWKGTVASSWADPITQEGRGEIESYLVIRQTFSNIDVRLLTAESASISLSASVLEDGDGLQTLAVIYRNTPRVVFREKSPIGHGGMLLYIRGSPVHQLDGEYWTDRKTNGEVCFTTRSPQLAYDFAQATKQAIG